MSGTRREPSFQRALITGASGFIGRALVRHLESQGVAVTGTARRSSESETQASNWVTGDLGDRDFVHSLLSRTRADVIFNLAAKVTGQRGVDAVGPTVRANLVGTVNILEAATEIGCDRIVLIGSSEEPFERNPASSPYAASKASQAIYAQMFHALYGAPVTTARVFMTYGPDQPDETKLVPYTITTLLRGEPPRLSSGHKQCDWVYVDDVVDALVAIAQAKDVDGRVIDVGTGTLHPVRQVVEMVADLVDPSAPVAWGAIEDRPMEAERAADTSTAADLLSWSASTDLVAGLARTVTWYTQRHSQRA